MHNSNIRQIEKQFFDTNQLERTKQLWLTHTTVSDQQYGGQNDVGPGRSALLANEFGLGNASSAPKHRGDEPSAQPAPPELAPCL
jgi:hypothetical protein